MRSRGIPDEWVLVIFGVSWLAAMLVRKGENFRQYRTQTTRKWCIIDVWLAVVEHIQTASHHVRLVPQSAMRC